jgi:adenylate cyclase
MTGFRRLWEGVKQKRVYRVGSAYIAVGAAVATTADYLFDVLGYPREASLFVLILVVLGLPLALVVASGQAGPANAPQGSDRSPDPRDAPLHVMDSGRALDRRSVAVLPFKNLSSDSEQEFFSDGMTDDVITQLSKIRDLHVVSRTSVMRYREPKVGLREIARELGVRSVVEGSVRRAGERLRISVQLVDASKDRHLWAETFDRYLTDVFAIQSEIATEIAAALDASLSPQEREELRDSPTHDLEAYDLLLRGRYHYARAEFWKSVEYYRRAIERDAELTEAHAALAEAWFYQGTGYWDLRPRDAYPQTKRAASRALHLDPEHPDALAIHGFNEFWHHFDWSTAEVELTRAIELNPKSTLPRLWYAVLRMCGGRFEEAEAEIGRCLEQDPGNLVIINNAALIAYFAGDNERSVRRFERMAEMSPSYPWWAMVGLPYVKMGRLAEAVSAFEEGVRLSKRANMQLQLLAYGHAAAGDGDASRSLLAELEARERDAWVYPLGFAYAHAHLGERDRALMRLEHAFEERASVFFFRDPAFQVLLEEPRYRRILEESGQDFGL